MSNIWWPGSPLPIPPVGGFLPIIVPSMAALQAIDGTLFNYVFRSGYYTDADGSFGLYFYNPNDTTTPINGGTVVGSSIGLPGRWFKCGEGDILAKDFGAKFDGVTNDSAPLQLAHATGLPVHYPAGTTILSAGMNIGSSAGGIIGESMGTTKIVCNDVSGNDIFTFTKAGNNFGYDAPVFKNFGFTGTLSKTNGACFRFNSAAQQQFIEFSSVTFTNIPTAIYYSTAAYFKIDKCNFTNYCTAAVHIENTLVSDSGDSIITNSHFNTSTPSGSAYAVWHRSAGGLKFSSNKILGGDAGYVVGWIGGNGAADLSIVNNSIEDTLTYGIFLGRDAGTGVIGSVMIGDNEIGCKTGISTDTSGFMTLLTINGNVINIAGTNTTFFGISLNNVSNFAIGHNVLNGSQGGGSPIGLGIAANCSNGKVAAQTYVGLTDANALQTSSTTVFVEGSAQSGVASITASTAYGTLFTGQIAVTFPVPYKQIPTVRCGPSGTGGGQINVFPANVTKTGFTMIGVSATNGGAMANNTWVALGVI